MSKTKPNKKELATFKVLSDLSYTPNAIGKKVGRDPKTVRKYLDSDVYNDPDLQQMVTVIKEKELDDLFLLGAKARNRLHELLDEGKTKTIETVALMDRSFQQRQLLQHKSTSINELRVITAEMEQLQKAIDAYEAEHPEVVNLTLDEEKDDNERN